MCLVHFGQILNDKPRINLRPVIKLQIPKYDLNNCNPPPPIFYKPNPTIGKTLTDKSDSLMVDIKTQPGDRDSKTVAINVPLFRNRIP